MMKPSVYYTVTMGMEPKDCLSEADMDNYKLEYVLGKMIEENKEVLVCKRCDQDYVSDSWEIKQENNHPSFPEGFVCIDCRPYKGYKRELGSSVLKSDVNHTVEVNPKSDRVAPTLAPEEVSGVSKLVKRGSF